jgi:hypothetical protein
MNIPKGMLLKLDLRVRKIVNNFIKGQSLQRSFIYCNVRNGGLGIPCLFNEYYGYKVNHVANLLSSEDGKKILKGYIYLNKKIARNQDLVEDLKEALNELNIRWCDWEDFELQRMNWEWKANEKDDGKQYFNFIDTTSEHKYKGRKRTFTKVLLLIQK